MKIESLSPPSSTPMHRKGRSSCPGASNFASQLPGESAGPLSVSAVTAVTAVDSLLALQEISAVPLGHAPARRYGEALREQLDKQRHVLSIGAMPLIQRERLAETLNVRRGEIGDPRLGEVVEEIELRAAVELAKLGR